MLNKLKSIHFLFYLLLALLLINFVYADVPIIFRTGDCPSNKVEVRCDYYFIELFGRRVHIGCEEYYENPKCEHIGGGGSTWGGESIYCCEPDFSNYASIYVFYKNLLWYTFLILLSILLTLLLELPIFWIFGFRDKKSLFIIILANLTSLPLFYIATRYIYFYFTTSFGSYIAYGYFSTFLWFSDLIPVLIFEIPVIIYEALFLIIFLKNVNTKKILLAVFIANIFSATIGGLILSLILY